MCVCVLLVQCLLAVEPHEDQHESSLVYGFLLHAMASKLRS